MCLCLKPTAKKETMISEKEQGVLDLIDTQKDEVIDYLRETATNISEFFDKAIQVDNHYIENELKAEVAEVL